MRDRRDREAKLHGGDAARVVPAHSATAVRYSGTWSRRGYEKHLARLRAWMTEHDLDSAGAPVWARYNAPFTPWFLRRNEVLIPLAQENLSNGRGGGIRTHDLKLPKLKLCLEHACRIYV